MQRQESATRHPKRYGLEWRILKQTPAAFLLSGLAVYLTNQLAHWLIVAENASLPIYTADSLELIDSENPVETKADEKPRK